MGSWWRRALAASIVAAFAIVGAACGSGMTVRAEVLQPARVPVRAFPRILVVSAANPESARVAQAVARHLASGRSTVEIAEPRRVQTLRADGRIERATVVIELAVRLRREDRPELARSDELECGPLGCFESRRSFVRDVPLVRARLSMRVSDGPSGRTLQRVELAEEETGIDELAIRMRVIERLSDHLLGLVDQRARPVSIELFAIDRPEVREALDAVRAGDWRAAREGLRAFVGSGEFEALAPEQRALVLYDLGQVARFDPALEPEERFERAEQALRMAVRLAPQPRFARALAELEEHRLNRDMVREQQAAMAHNFALHARTREAPEAPPGYD